MLRRYIEAGQIVSTQGLKGEVRVQPWCDSPEFLGLFEVLYLDEKGERPIKIQKVRPHGNIAVVKMEGVDDIDTATQYRGRVLYIDREDASLPENTFFVTDLIGCDVLDADSGICYGKLSDVSVTGANDVWHVTAADGREYLLPAIPSVVDETDPVNGRITVRPLKGIFDDEN